MAKKGKSEDTRKNAVAELAQILTDDPLIGQKICEAIQRHLNKVVDGHTFANIYFSLDILVGAKAAKLITDSCKANSSKFFADIKRQIKGVRIDKVVPFLQYLTALYGDDIKELYYVSGEVPDDWNSAKVVAIYEEAKKKEWFIELTLTKFNGEMVYLRMPAKSSLALARRFLREIGKMPKEVFSDENIKRFNEETKAFQEKFLGKSSNKD